MAKTKDIPRKFQTYYDRYHVDEAQVFDPVNSLTDQDYKYMTDVNYLLEHMAGHSRTPLYGMQETMTFEDWSNEMAMVKRRFNNLDEEQRRKFENPQKFLEWCSNPENYAEMLPSHLSELEMEKGFKKKKDLELYKEDRLVKKLAKIIKE